MLKLPGGLTRDPFSASSHEIIACVVVFPLVPVTPITREGNIILQAVSQSVGLEAARRASEAVAGLPGVIAPFPGGVVRSGSKVGSRYEQLVASTNEALSPGQRSRSETELVEGANCCYELVMDGIDEGAVSQAMRAAIEAASGDGVLAIGAGNYGGKLGKFNFHLHKVMGDR